MLCAQKAEVQKVGIFWVKFEDKNQKQAASIANSYRPGIADYHRTKQWI